MWSMRFVLNVLARRMIPCTSYPLESSNSARYEPSCPVIPVMSARFMYDVLPRVFSSEIPRNLWLSSENALSLYELASKKQTNALSLVPCSRFRILLGKNGLVCGSSEEFLVPLLKIVQQIQTIVTQKQSTESTHVAIQTMPGGHGFSIHTRILEEVQKIVPAVRSVKRETVRFLRFGPLFQIRAHVLRGQVVTVAPDPTFDFRRQCGTHRHPVFDAIAGQLAIDLGHVESIRSVNPVFRQKLWKREHRRHKNDERGQKSIGLRPKRFGNGQQLVQYISPERETRSAHHRIYQQSDGIFWNAAGNLGKMAIEFQLFSASPQVRPVVNHAGVGVFLKRLAHSAQFVRQPHVVCVQRGDNLTASFRET